MSSPRLLVISDGASSTGFSRVVDEIFSRLVHRFRIHQLMLNHRRRPPAEPPWPFDVCDIVGDPSGFERLRRLLPALEPDLIFILYDLRVAGLLSEEIRRTAPASRVVVYAPVEGRFSHPRAIRRLALADRLIPFTHFGAGELAGAAATLAADEERFPFSVGDVVPHGIDIGKFHPVTGGRRAARRALFPDRGDLDRAFVVLNANRNQPRKRIDLTLEAFRRFSAGREDAYLCLHMGRRDYGVDVLAMAHHLGIADRLLLTQDGDHPPSFSEEKLNLVFNACDVGMNTSMGEGWGLVSFEHASTGAAQIIPGHSVGPELWRGAALLVPAPTAVANPDSYMEQRAVDPAEVASALGRLYEDRALLVHLSQAARRRATAEELGWDRIAERFGHLLRDESRRLAPSKPLFVEN